MTKRDWTRFGGWTSAALVVGLALFSMRREASATENTLAERPAEVGILTVARSTVTATHVFHGVVRPARRAQLSFVEGGRVEERFVNVGERVEAGQVLARLDSRPYRNVVRATSASRRELVLQREQLARDRGRAERLARSGFTTTARLEQVASGHDRVASLQAAAGANASEARRRHGETDLRAPFAGVVTDVLVEPGELVSAGQPLVRIAGDGGREVLVDVSVEIASTLATGDPVSLRAVGVEADDPLSSEQVEGRVRSVASEDAAASGLYPVLIDVVSSVPAGLGVEVTLDGPAREALLVPLAAVLDPSGRRPFVWTVTDGRARRSWLRLGRLGGGQVEAHGGLSEGDRVVIRGHQRLLEGDVVATRSGS